MELSQRLDLGGLELDGEDGEDKAPSSGDVFGRLAELVDTLGGSDITPATRLDEAGLTSLDRIELAVRIEEEFAVRIDEHVYATHDTAGELAHYIEEQQ